VAQLVEYGTFPLQSDETHPGVDLPPVDVGPLARVRAGPALSQCLELSQVADVVGEA